MRTFPAEAAAAWAFGLTAFLSFSMYRAVLWVSLARSSQPPLGFVIERFWFQEFVTASGWDLFVAALLGWSFHSKATGSSRRAVRWGVGLVVLWILVFICVVHLKLLLVRGEHVGYDAAREAISGALTAQEALGYTTRVEWLLLLGPFPTAALCLWMMRRLSERGRFVTASLAAVLAVTVAFSAVLKHHTKFRPHFHLNPVVFGVIDLFKGMGRPDSYIEDSAKPVSAEQAQALQFVDPEFVEEGRREVPPRVAVKEDAPPPDLVFIIMESTRLREVFRRTPDGSMVMPFLKSLARESWWMTSHHSTSNSSHRSLFSIFTGLYPSFGRSYFCITSGVAVPTLSSFLPANYERFLYTPGDLRSYFPRVLLEKSGMKELYGRSDLLDRRKREATSIALNEFDALEPFLDRVQQSEGPFFGVYYSYVPHFSYRPVGSEFQVMKDVSNPQNRYVNNLRALDRVIERIVGQLKSSGRWDNTVFAIVGDHGESFGERGLFTHANDLHEEQIRVPWLLRFPGVRPRVVDELTSHVDILPTVLDTLGISAEPGWFQGESLWNEERRRRYVFGVGNERSYYALDNSGTKVIFRERANSCLLYELAADPGERHAGKCLEAPRAFQALADFRSFQTERIRRYSRDDTPSKPPLLPH